MNTGDRVTGPVALPVRRGEPFVLVDDTGTVVSLYDGMVTNTPWALVRWDHQGLHVHEQAALTPESVA